MLFHDRTEAGRTLATRLAHHAGQPGLLVLALPRGGVPVAFEVAHSLGAELDVFLVRKLGFPGQEELAMGAIAAGGVRVLNPEVVGPGNVSDATIELATTRELAELERREGAYRDGRPPADPRGRTVILVDDGLATGSTMLAAVEAVRLHEPDRVVVAVPVASISTRDAVGSVVDEIVCAATPEPFYAVGAWYDDFAQTTDDEVRELLRAARCEP